MTPRDRVSDSSASPRQSSIFEGRWPFSRLSVRHARVLALTVVGSSLLAGPAVAQSAISQVGQAMCRNGIGDIITFGLAALAILLIILAAYRGMLAFNKMGSHQSDKQYEGKEQMVGAVKTFAGAFVPLIFGGVLDVLGVNTISCLDFDIGILVILF